MITKNKNIKNKTAHMSPIQGHRELIYTDKQKANTFAKTLEKQFTVNTDTKDDPDWEEHIEATYEDKPTNITEIKSEIHNLKSRKVPGFDSLTNQDHFGKQRNL